MPTIAVEVSEEIAEYWAELARREALPLATWLSWCGSWGAALDLPIRRIVLQQPTAARVLQGVVWEITRIPSSNGGSTHERL